MADTIIRLKVESQEYEGKIKRAVQGMQQLEKHVRDMGASFEVAEKADLEFVRALGQMETQTKSVKGQMREFQEAILSLQQQYENLTDVEKAAPFGKAMAASIEALKTRASNLKDNMMDLDQELKNMASDTKVFDQLAGGVNLMVSAFQVGQGALQLFGIENENAVEAMAKLQGAMAVTQGLQQIQNALQKQSTTMMAVATLQKKALAAAEALDTAAKSKNIAITVAATAAQKALNVVANANPYILLASAVIALGAALSSLTKKSKEAANQNTQVSKSVEESRKRWQEYSDAIGSEIGGVLSAYARLKIEWEGLSGLQEKNNWIQDNQDEFDKLKISINDVADAENAFVKNTEKVVMALQLRARSAALQRLAEEEYAKYYKAMYTSRPEDGEVREGEVIHGPTPRSAKRKNYYEKVQGLTPGEDFDPLTYKLTQSGADKINAKHARNHGALTLQEIYERYFSKALYFEEQWKNMFKDAGVQSRTENGGGGVVTISAKEEEEVKSAADMWNAHIEKLQEMETLLEEFKAMSMDMSVGDDQRSWASNMVEKYQKDIDNLKNRISSSGSPLLSTFEQLKRSIRIELADDNFSIDESSLKNLLTIAIQNGIDSLDPDFESLQYKIAEGLDIPDSAWNDLVEDINAKLKELGIDPIVLDVKTGDVKAVEQEAKNTENAWQKAADAVSNLGSALQNVEDPSAKVAGIVLQAVANIALGFAQATASQATGASGVFGWIAAATAGLATMTATIASIKSVTQGFADGGMVGGNSYSGDNIVARLNSGEGVLTAAGVRNAQAMASNTNPMGGMQLEALVSGESLRLVLANNASRRGGSRSQYAISKFG